MFTLDYITKIIKLQDNTIDVLEANFLKKEKGFMNIILTAKQNLTRNKINHCNDYKVVIKGYYTKKLILDKILGYNCILEIRMIRFKCKICNHTFTQELNLINKKQKITKAQRLEIILACKEICSFSSIAKRFNVSVSSVINIFKNNVSLKRLELTEAIGIDEFRGTSKNSLYCFIIKDLINNRIIDILESRRREKLDEYFSKIPKDEREKVKYVCMDLSNIYKSVIKFWFKNSKIIADKFHYTRLIYNDFNKIRIKLMKEYNELSKIENDRELIEKYKNNYYLLKKYWKLIMKYEDDVENKEHYNYKLRRKVKNLEILDMILNMQEKFTICYFLKNGFTRLIETSTYENFDKKFESWIDQVEKEEINEFETSIRTLLKWRNEIRNSFIIDKKYNRSFNNASTEGSNNLCKVIKRVSFGYKDFELMRKRILYCSREEIILKN